MSVDWTRVKAVCLDMDGTLIHSDAAWKRATETAFGRFGLCLTEAHYEETLGLDNAAGVAAVLRHFPSFRGNAAELTAALETAIQNEFRRGVTPMPGAERLLAEWHRRWPLALVSTSSPALIAAALEGLNWDRYFVFRLSSEEVGPGKPDPAVYREAVRRLGVAAGAALAVEDSVAGVQSAAGAGLQVIGLASDSGLAARLRPHAAAVIAGWADLLNRA